MMYVVDFTSIAPRQGATGLDDATFVLIRVFAMEVYQVGGAVRDHLLGREIKDRDWVVVGATGEELSDRGYKKVGADFPVFLHPDTAEEYALARTERKSGAGYKGFETSSSRDVTLEQDLARRDLTINAMAMRPDGAIVDPYGGQEDLKRGILRHITGAFVEDPVRVLRTARFAARFDFSIALETLNLMREIADSGELSSLIPERVWRELRGALNENHPARFLEELRSCGANRKVFPEIDRLFGVPQSEKYHPEIDTGEHVLLALTQAARRNADETIRFSVLVHNLGKGTTPAEIPPSHHGHEERGVELINEFCERLRVPREHRDLAVLVSRFQSKVHRADELKPATMVRLLQDIDALRRRERFDAFLEACTIDATGRLGLQDRDYSQAERLRRALAIVQSVDAGKLIEQGFEGEALASALFDARVEVLTRSGN